MSTRQCESATWPAKQLGLSLPEAPFTENQQRQSRYDGGLEYGVTLRRLVPVQQRLGGELLLVVRVFLDEPGGGAGNEWPLPRSLVRAPPPDVLGGPVSLGFAPMHLR